MRLTAQSARDLSRRLAEMLENREGKLQAVSFYELMQVSNSAAERVGVNERIRFTDHRGRQIPMIDLSHSSVSVVVEIVQQVPEVVPTQPYHSLLIFADFTAAALNAETLIAMKVAAVFDKPYVKKTAWIGAEAIPPEFMQGLTTRRRPGLARAGLNGWP
jgi:hypothetical protein